MYKITICLTFLLAQSLLAVPALKPKSSAQFFVSPNQTSVISFQVPEGGAASDYSVTIHDISGLEVSRSTASAKDAGQLDMEVKLPQGYYVITFPDLDQEFGLVVAPPFEGERDPFFGIDAALSWLSAPETRKDKVDILKYCGVSIARERLRWGEIEPASGKFDWQTSNRYDELRKLYADAGIRVLEVFHSVPLWMRRDSAGVYPLDLVATSESWRKVAIHWKDEWAALDIWNEPDISFGGNQPASRYAALAKTIAYTTRQAAPNTELGAVVLAYLTMPFLELAARNGVLDVCDFFSFHYYKDPAGLATHIREIRNWLNKFDRQDMPMWITEMGRSWVRKGDEIRPSQEADLERAWVFARDVVESKANGISAIFPFVFVDYSEKGSEMFGMMDIQGSPEATIAAYAQSIRILQEVRYLGDIKSSPGSRVFQRNDGTVIVAWISMDAPAFPVRAMEGLDGRALDQPADGFSYLFTTLDAIRGELATDTDAMQLYKMAPVSSAALSDPSPIVLSPQVKDDEVTVVNRGYQLANDLKTLTVDLHVANLGGEEKSLSIDVRSGEGKESAPVTNMPSEGLWAKLKRWIGWDAPAPKDNGLLAHISLTVPPASTASHVVTVDVSNLSPDASGTAWLNFIPEDSSIAPACIALIPSLGLSEHLKAFDYQFAVPISDLSRWSKNSSGKESLSKSAEDNWKLNVVFEGQGDRWVYPKIKLPQEVQNDRVSAVLIRARFSCEGEHSIARFMSFDRNEKNSVTGFSIIPNDGEWHVALIPLDAYLQAPNGKPVGSLLDTIALGFNTKQDSGELEVSDLYLLGN